MACEPEVGQHCNKSTSVLPSFTRTKSAKVTHPYAIDF